MLKLGENLVKILLQDSIGALQQFSYPIHGEKGCRGPNLLWKDVGKLSFEGDQPFFGVRIYINWGIKYGNPHGIIKLFFDGTHNPPSLLLVTPIIVIVIVLVTLFTLERYRDEREREERGGESKRKKKLKTSSNF